MKKVITFLIMITLLSTAYADKEPKVYMCIPDYSTGFAMEKGKWKPATFSVEGLKYILKKNEKSEWQWSKFGEGQPVADISHCSDGFTVNGYMGCTLGANEISFNRQSLRFSNHYMIGYILSNDKIGTKREGFNVPSIIIGTCSTL